MLRRRNKRQRLAPFCADASTLALRATPPPSPSLSSHQPPAPSPRSLPLLSSSPSTHPFALMSRDGDRTRLLDGNSSSSFHAGTAAAAGPGVNRLGDLFSGAPPPPPPEVHVSVEKQQVCPAPSCFECSPQSHCRRASEPCGFVHERVYGGHRHTQRSPPPPLPFFFSLFVASLPRCRCRCRS
jgi:hypothetical protein